MYKLFEEMPPPSPKIYDDLSAVIPPPFPHGPPPFMIEGAGPPPAVEAGSVTSDYEFYPVDPISRFVQVYCFTIPTLIVSL